MNDLMRLIAESEADFCVATEGALLSPAGRERLRRQMYDAVLAALVAYEQYVCRLPQPSIN